MRAPNWHVNFLTTVVVSLPYNAFIGGVRRTQVDRDRAHHSSVVLGGTGSGVRRCGGMEFSGNVGRVILLFKTQQIATICLK